VSTTLALEDCKVWRPAVLGGRVEIVSAEAAPRSFPTRLSETLGVCLKRGAAHALKADGRDVVYPRNAVCIRPPGCIWTSETAEVGFLSIDVSTDLLPPEGIHGAMIFRRRRDLTDVTALSASLLQAASPLEADELVVGLITAIVDSGTFATECLRDEGQRGRAVGRTREYLAAHFASNPCLDDLAAAAQVNKFVLVRHFRRTLGTTPHAYLTLLRLDFARALLARGASIAEVAVSAGFSDQAHLGRFFKRLYGVTPAAYVRGARAVVAVPRSISFKTRSAP
jgi:AraC-like DNA-binding protein